MLQRFVITEFFRKPDEDWGMVRNWYYKNTDIVKRRIIVHFTFVEDRFYDEQGKPHRDFGQPAVITTDGQEEYYYHGKCHRGHFDPAIIRPNGIKEYWIYGEKRFETCDLSNSRFI